MKKVCKRLLGSKAKPFSPKQSVKFTCQIWSEITKKFDKNCLDVFSFHYIFVIDLCEH